MLSIESMLGDLQHSGHLANGNTFLNVPQDVFNTVLRLSTHPYWHLLKVSPEVVVIRDRDYHEVKLYPVPTRGYPRESKAFI